MPEFPALSPHENSSNEKRLAALGSRGRGPPQSGGRAWSFRLLEFHRHSAGENGKCGQRDLWSRCPGKTCRKRQAQRERTAEPVPRLATGESAVSQKGRLDFSTFAISNTLFKCIALIIRRVQSGDLLDCPLLAIKPPFHPRSSRCSFSKHLYTKHFPKHALLDLPRSLKPRRKVNQNHGTFPGGEYSFIL